jgi:hypothetical protein
MFRIERRADGRLETSHRELISLTDESVAIAATARTAEIESISIQKIKSSHEEDIATLGAVIQEIREGSITPTTFASREFENSVDDWYYKDIYEYRGNEVARFGLNVLALPDSASLSKIDIEPLAPSDSASETSSARESNPSASKKSHSSQGKKPVILPKYYTLEIELLQKAITFLLDNEDHKTVVVDILAQEYGELKIDKFSGQLETHAVLLYKNPIVVASVPTEAEETKAGTLKDDSLVIDATPRHEIVVIDPSNSAYSAHLAGLERIVSHEGLATIIAFTSKKFLQIYKPGDSNSIGSGHDQYRDCIDIAVKLAFGLHGYSHELKINSIKQLIDLPIVKQLSNQRQIDEYIIDETLPVRIKQTSDIKIVSDFYMAEKIIKKNLTIIANRFDEEGVAEFTRLKLQYRTLLENEPSNILIFKGLLTCNQECIDIFIRDHKALEDQLLGALNEDIGASI